MNAQLNGLRILITGAGRGLGQSHALHLAGYKAHVIIHDLEEELALNTKKEVEEAGGNASVLVSDIRNIDKFQKDLKSCGSIDVLVNNAGIGGAGKKIDEIDFEVFDEMYRVHVAGTFFATQAILPQMKARKQGKIINTTSIFAQVGHYESSHYVAAKSAISGLTKAWAREFAPWNIKVNSIAPGFIETEMTRLSTTQEQIESLANAIPLGRLCSPIDISYAVAWLASFETNQMTGQVISPNAGQVIC
tara:strand:+ start:3923 stop:4666 length:744 start_codon:yes stop_codon:yes gene_type:complete